MKIIIHYMLSALLTALFTALYLLPIAAIAATGQ